ncbi:hypothetical protein DN068_00040 [Taibaiella soli]|uniref:Uncharacterized protein n=1 Tax=Taibaiella soli TaxID=1649169 RepID=A0A2W2BFG9_9BACT|nr:hypothetical protein DN068_00040 [Taibaiella soli]
MKICDCRETKVFRRPNASLWTICVRGKSAKIFSGGGYGEAYLNNAVIMKSMTAALPPKPDRNLISHL